jgi:hypothetical protein
VELRSEAARKGDEVLLGMLTFVELMDNHCLLDGAIRMGDFLLAELLTNKWLPHW